MGLYETMCRGVAEGCTPLKLTIKKSSCVWNNRREAYKTNLRHGIFMHMKYKHVVKETKKQHVQVPMPYW